METFKKLIKPNFIRMDEFARRHDVSIANIHVANNEGRLPSYTFTHSRGIMYINESYFLRRDTFARYIRTEAQSAHYELYELLGRSAIVGRLMVLLGAKTSDTVFNDFMSNKLYKNKSFSILSFSISPVMRDFFIYSRKLLHVVLEVGIYNEKIITQYIEDQDLS